MQRLPDWQMNSVALGNFVLPAMQELPKRIPKLAAAMLCTPDGFNICSLGVDERQVGKLAALSGSLLSVGSATMTELRASQSNVPPELLTIQSGTFQIVSLRVRQASGYLTLTIAADDTPLGVMLVGGRYVAGVIEALFAAPPPP